MSERSAAQPVPYIERTRNYYRALGYKKDYWWAHHEHVPFARLAKRLRLATVALVTTAGPPDRSNRDARNHKHVWSGEIANPPSAFDTDVAWDKESTHVNDRETFLPIDAMTRLVADGTLGALSHRFHHAPTDYSQRKTNELDAPQIYQRLRDDKVHAAVLSAL
jgi:hypothetical protein